MLAADDIRLLDRLTIASPAAAAGTGARQARTRGNGLEFRDYRPYLPGDDPRAIDWTVDARLRQLVVRVVEADAHARLHLLVDTSASMSVGTPPKIAGAARAAAAFAYVAVQRRDPVGLVTFAQGIERHVGVGAGRQQLFRILATLERSVPQGTSSFDGVLMSFGGVATGPGTAVIVSDFLGGDVPSTGLKYLLHRGIRPALVQIVADEDLEPRGTDNLELIDAERPDASPVFADAAAIGRYRERVAAHVSALRQFAQAHRIPIVQIRSSATFESAMTACVSAGLFTVHA